jgi:hypothetical protein
MMPKKKLMKMKARRKKKRKMAGQFFPENCIGLPPYFSVIWHLPLPNWKSKR